MKLLLYGGCHALVLRDLLEEILGDRISTQLIINFQLIQSGRPFPEDVLDTVDVVLFSPIENKGAYNTSHLREVCERRGVRTVVFPWLEWHGYCPGALKGTFKGRFQWHYPELVALAGHFARFEDFCDHVIAEFPNDSTIDETLARSTALLKAAEDRCEMTVRISDFILEVFKTERLFLISDHPSLRIYVEVLRQILAQLGLEDRSGALDRLAAGGRIEPQWRWRIPILPRVARRLGLSFEDTDWVDDEVVPGRALDLRVYLRLYFNPNSVILGPIGAAPVVLDHQDGSRSVAVIDPAARLIADPLDPENLNQQDSYTLLQSLSGDVSALRQATRFGIRPHEWRTTWQF